MLPKRDSYLWKIVFLIYDALVSHKGFLAIGFHRARLDWDSHVKSSTKDSPAQKVSIPDPLNPETELVHSFGERYTWELSDVLLSMTTGRMFINGHAVLDSSSWGYERRLPRLKPRPVRTLRFSEPVIFARPSPWNYYHWLIEDLPSILRARQSHPNARVIITVKSPRYVVQSLEAYGVTPLIIRSRWVFADQLILAGRGFDTGWPHKQDIELLQGGFSPLGGEPVAADKKIYLSRAQSRRGFPNEQEVEAIAIQNGFQPVHMEDLSFAEQVRLFQTSSHIVGLHGAGLANMVFSQPGTSIKELTPTNTANPCYEMLAKVSEHNYERLLVESHGRRDVGAFDLSSTHPFHNN